MVQHSLAGRRLFFLSGLLGDESWESMESVWSTPRGVSAMMEGSPGTAICGGIEDELEDHDKVIDGSSRGGGGGKDVVL